MKLYKSIIILTLFCILFVIQTFAFSTSYVGNIFVKGNTTLNGTNVSLRQICFLSGDCFTSVASINGSTSDTNESTRVGLLETLQSADNTTQSGLIAAKHTPGTCAVGTMVQNTTTSGVECISDSDTSYWNKSGTNLYYNPVGNVSIGTMNPARLLHIQGTNADILLNSTTDTWTTLILSSASGVDMRMDASRSIENYGKIGTASEHDMIIQANATEMMRLYAYGDEIKMNATLRLTDLVNCDTIDTNSSGVLACGTDDDTTYSAGNGISLAGTTFSVAGNTALTQDSDGLSVTAGGITNTQLEYDTGQHLTTASNVRFANVNVTGILYLPLGNRFENNCINKTGGGALCVS